MFFFVCALRDRNRRDRIWPCIGQLLRKDRQDLSHGKRLAGFLPATAQPPVSDKRPLPDGINGGVKRDWALQQDCRGGSDDV